MRSDGLVVFCRKCPNCSHLLHHAPNPISRNVVVSISPLSLTQQLKSQVPSKSLSSSFPDSYSPKRLFGFFSMKGHGALEVAKTVLEVADVAWTAVEHCQHHHHPHAYHGLEGGEATNASAELESLKSENRRLRNLLEQNLKLLRHISESPALLDDCPPDLYANLVATVDSKNFLNRLKSLKQASIDGTGNEFPFREATGADLHSAEILINVSHEEPSWWVWVTDDMVPSNVEEWSGIDNDSYVVLGEEHVVDGVANFMARCMLSNPKAQNLTPEELQKTMAKALGGVSKLEKMLDIWHAGALIYTLSTWGLALAGLYKSRAILKVAAKGVHRTSRVVMRAL